MLNRIEVTAPPKGALPMMPMNRYIALIGGSPMVKGSRIAIAASEVRPGSRPNSRPMLLPSAINAMFCGCASAAAATINGSSTALLLAQDFGDVLHVPLDEPAEIGRCGGGFL